jgi:hypothetical protein
MLLPISKAPNVFEAHLEPNQSRLAKMVRHTLTSYTSYTITKTQYTQYIMYQGNTRPGNVRITYEARSRNHCCRGKAINIKQYEREPVSFP